MFLGVYTSATQKSMFRMFLGYRIAGFKNQRSYGVGFRVYLGGGTEEATGATTEVGAYILHRLFHEISLDLILPRDVGRCPFEFCTHGFMYIDTAQAFPGQTHPPSSWDCHFPVPKVHGHPKQRAKPAQAKKDA